MIVLPEKDRKVGHAQWRTVTVVIIETSHKDLRRKFSLIRVIGVIGGKICVRI
jgi:hypothetical protein